MDTSTKVDTHTKLVTVNTSTKLDTRTRLVKWIIFSVILALLPLVFNYLYEVTRKGPPTIAMLLGKGELLLIAASLSAAVVGDLIGTGNKQLMWKLIVGGSAAILLCITSLYFASISSAPPGEHLNTEIIAKYSLFFFFFSVIVGIACIPFQED